MSIPMTVEVIDLGDISLLSLDGVGNSIYCREIAAITLSLSSAVPGTLLLVVVLHWISEGSLLNGR